MSAVAGVTARVTASSLAQFKESGTPIAMVTAYDAPGARLAEEAGVDAILVGDSLGMTVLGYESTLPVTMDDMVRHTAAVARATSRALVIADMPFGSYQASPDDAVANAARLLAEGGAAAVKIEGGVAVALLVERLVSVGIPVMGHIGLTPQSVHVFGGYRVQGRDTDAALALVGDAFALEEAGAFAVVLELIPAELAAIITEELAIPTIGIGAGGFCDGQVQVFHDLLGLGAFTPRHARQYVDTGAVIREALGAYADDVRSGAFPAEENLTHLAEEVLGELETALPPTAGDDA
jgi:3-methyl-2-oxobutanoate hydroxymethyltransferase